MIRGNNLIIVAHPDDEILFAYSQLVNSNWHVVSVTGANRQTKTEFMDIMSSLNLTCNIWEHDDSWNGTFSTNEISSKLIPVLSKGFDNILTHGPSGEYGHTQHKDLYRIVSSLVHENLYIFGQNIKPISFNLLRGKIEMLSRYKGQCVLNAFDWYDENNPTNNLIKYVSHEGFEKIK